MNETNEPTHIGQSPSWNRQKLEWTDIPIQTPITLEIINWNKIKNKRYKNTWYISFVAQINTPIKNYTQPGDLAILDIPYRTMERMIDKIPLNQKRNIKNCTSNDNVTMTITKTTKQGFSIQNIQLKPEQPDLTKQANEILYEVNQ